jgi:hypothetical protein
VGTRDRIISYLGSVSDITDPSGMASTRLAEAVGYPGSSVAFAQLLSGMERDGLISREVRGKRTYRIILAPGVQPGRARTGDISVDAAAQGRPAGGAAMPAVIGLPSAAVPAFDYDELARRLLIQVIRRLATPPEGQEGVVADLERELTTARGHASTLTAENRKLREQLRQVQSSLDAARRTLDTDSEDAGGYEHGMGLSGTGPVSEQLSHAEVVLLERLVSPGHDASLDADAIAPDATAS